MFELFEDRDFLESFNMNCAIECEEYEKQLISDRTCPHCKTVWEDIVSKLTCPCHDDTWVW